MNRRVFVLPSSETIELDIEPTDTVYDLKKRIFQNTGGWYNFLLDSGEPLGATSSSGLYDKATNHFPPVSDEESSVFLIQAYGPGGAEPHRLIFSEQAPPRTSNSNSKTRKSLKQSLFSGLASYSAPAEEPVTIWSVSTPPTGRSARTRRRGKKDTRAKQPTKAEIYDAVWAILEDAAVKAEEKGIKDDIDSWNELQIAIPEADNPDDLIRQEAAMRKERNLKHLKHVGREVTSALHTVAGPYLFGSDTVDVPGTGNRPVKSIKWKSIGVDAKHARYDHLSSLLPNLPHKGAKADETYSYSQHINSIREALRKKR